MAYTPGPWEFKHYDMLRGMYQVETSYEDDIAFAYERDDARLIAQAPALLEACKALTAYIDAGDFRGNSLTDIMNRARAAIAAAGGGG